jgi:hypothetical protein
MKNLPNLSSISRDNLKQSKALQYPHLGRAPARNLAGAIGIEEGVDKGDHWMGYYVKSRCSSQAKLLKID